MKQPLALRNLTRQPRRTAIALSAIAFSVIALLLSAGFFQFILWYMQEATINSRLGHVQIVKQGYRQSGGADPFAYLLPAASPQLDLLKRLPQTAVVAARLDFSGVISLGDTTLSFTGEGVEPAKERTLSEWVAITAGDNLDESDPTGIILGAGLAASLGAKPGDTVVLLATAGSGSMNGVEGRVRGIFATFIKAYDNVALRVPLPLARQLLRVAESHSWVMLLRDTAQTEAVIDAIVAPMNAAGLQVIGWRELADFYNKSVVLFGRQVNVIRTMIALIVLLSISNTLIMSVLERTGEIGTLMAIGSNRRRILGLFLAEGFFLTLAGGLIGVLLGTLAAFVISAIGIPMPPPPGSDRGFTAGILLTWPDVLLAVGVVLVTTLAASVYPAWKASRLVIVDALRHNR